MKFNPKKFDIAKFDSILARGLCRGIGTRGKQVCIEAAICQTLGLPHSDDPGCVAHSVRNFKICLNDAQWSSPKARAKGLRDLGIAQLGSKDTIDDAMFQKILFEKTVRVLIPALFRNLFPGNLQCLIAADLCEKEGTPEAARQATRAAAAIAVETGSEAARLAARAAKAAEAATLVAVAADAVLLATATEAAAEAAILANAATKTNRNKYLILSAKLALETLRELKSPGVQLLKKAK